MDLRKILGGSVVGVLASMAIGIVFYMLYYQDQLSELQAEFPNVMNTEPLFALGILVGFGQAFLTAMYFDKAGVDSLKSGAINGAWISAAIWIVANGNVMVMSKLTTMDYFLTDIVISAVMGAFTGAIMALAMKRMSK
jgi:hypothetical protein